MAEPKTANNPDESTKLAEDREQEPAEDIKEEIREEADADEPAPEADEPNANDVNDAAILRAGKLMALVAAYVPAGVDVESELDYVGGLSVKDGKLVGEAKYRKAPTEQTLPTKADTKKSAPRQADATAVDDWPKQRERIRDYKRQHGMIKD